MTEPLITIDDVKTFKGISSNINSQKDFDPLVIEAQTFDVPKIIGDGFFLDVIAGLNASPQEAKYVDLFNGKEYTVNGEKRIHFGLKAIIIYNAYARFLAKDGIQSTPSGFVVKQSQYSEPVDFKRLSMNIQQARSGAMAHEQRVVDFLQNNRDLYPNALCNKGSGYRKAGIKFRKIG